jgi:WD40 repeat protein
MTNCLILTRDNTCLICGCNGGYIRIWNLENGSLIKTIDKKFVEIVAFEITNDDRLICVERGGVIKVINLINNNCEKIFKGHLKKICSLKLLNENDFITCSRDGTVKHWKLDRVEYVNSFNVSEVVHCSEFY